MIVHYIDPESGEEKVKWEKLHYSPMPKAQRSVSHLEELDPIKIAEENLIKGHQAILDRETRRENYNRKKLETSFHIGATNSRNCER